MEQDITAPPVSRRESRKQDRRQAIVEAARASFLENGYSGTSMSALLKTLGGSKATLWSYFRSKEELFAAVIEDVSASFRAELDDVLTSAPDLESSLIAFCRTFLAKITSPEGQATWRLVVAESGRFPEVGRIFYDRAARLTQDALRAFLARQIVKGNLIPEEPEIMVETLMSLCVGQHMRSIWGLGQPTETELEECARRFARLFLKAYSLN